MRLLALLLLVSAAQAQLDPTPGTALFLHALEEVLPGAWVGETLQGGILVRGSNHRMRVEELQPRLGALLCTLTPFAGRPVTVDVAARFDFTFFMTLQAGGRLPAEVAVAGENGATLSRRRYADLCVALDELAFGAAPYDVQALEETDATPSDGATLRQQGGVDVYRSYQGGRLVAELSCQVLFEAARYRAMCEGVSP